MRDPQDYRRVTAVGCPNSHLIDDVAFERVVDTVWAAMVSQLITAPATARYATSTEFIKLVLERHLIFQVDGCANAWVFERLQILVC